MRQARFVILGCLVLVGWVCRAQAARTDPLRLIPNKAEFCVKLERPRQLLDEVLRLDYVKQLQGLDAFRELMDSTNARRFFQFLAYYEKVFGMDRLEMLDRLAGGGVVVGSQYGENKPAIFVIQGTDEAFMRRFFDKAHETLIAVLEREESKEKIEKSSHRNVDAYRIGKDLRVALLGSALVLSNKDDGLKAAIDLHLDGDANSLARSENVSAARVTLPKDPLVWAWFNLEAVQKRPESKETFKLPRNDPQITVLFGGWLDVAGRAPYLCAAMTRESDGFTTTIRMPRGTEGMNPGIGVHVPLNGQPGTRPLLEPKGVLYSNSFYLDISQFWEQRKQLFNETVLKTFEDADAKSAVFLAGKKLSQFFMQAGAYHRVVAVHQEKSSYKTQPNQRIPAFGVVMEMRDPQEFARSMEGGLRAGAFFASFQFKLKMAEEKYRDCKLTTYRFSETEPYNGDPTNFRYNFSPCFAIVGNQFVAASTVELGRELVDIISTDTANLSSRSSPAVIQTQFYASGGAELIGSLQDQIYAQVFLDQAVPPAEARKQVEALRDLVRKLGVLRLESVYGPNEFRYDIQWKYAK